MILSDVPAKSAGLLIKGRLPWGGRYCSESFERACQRSGLKPVVCVEDEHGQIWRVEALSRRTHGGTVYARVLQRMAQDAEREFSMVDLSAAFGSSKKHCSSVMSKMVRDGTVDRTGRGRFRLTEVGLEALKQLSTAQLPKSSQLGRPNTNLLRKVAQEKLSLAGFVCESKMGVLCGNGFSVRFYKRRGKIQPTVQGDDPALVQKIEEVLS